jgi:hypothetical protein
MNQRIGMAAARAYAELLKLKAKHRPIILGVLSQALIGKLFQHARLLS